LRYVGFDWTEDSEIYTRGGKKVVVKKVLIAREEKFWIESRERGGSEDGKSGGAKFGLGGVSIVDGSLFLVTLSYHFWNNYRTILMSIGFYSRGVFYEWDRKLWI
jgi:hypothetical protein